MILTITIVAACIVAWLSYELGSASGWYCRGEANSRGSRSDDAGDLS